MKIHLFEPIFQELRIRQVSRLIPDNAVLVDLGCDEPQVFIDRIRKRMKKCIGIDSVIKSKKYDNVVLLRQSLERKIDLPSNSADVITMLAVLEHMKYPEDIIRECRRILRKGGRLFVTVPSPASEVPLRIFSFLRLVRPEMIDQHENYFTPQRLEKMCIAAGFSEAHAGTFEFGFNVFLKAVK